MTLIHDVLFWRWASPSAHYFHNNAKLWCFCWVHESTSLPQNVRSITLQKRHCPVKKRHNIDPRWSVIEKAVLPFDRSLFCGTATTTNSAFIFGGRASPEQPSDQLFKLNLCGGQVSEVRNVSGQRPSARWKLTLTAISDNELILVSKVMKLLLLYLLLGHNKL